LRQELETKSDKGDDVLSTAIVELPVGESLFEQPEYVELMREFVPNPVFAKLLNKDGEISVNDTIYKITPNGTYYFHKKNKELFTLIFTKDTAVMGRQIGDKIHQIVEGIYRYDTYYHKNKPESGEFISPIITRNIGSEPDINSYPTFNANKTTVVGKIIQNLIGSTKDHTQYYTTTDNRRVRGSFYFYNYVVYAEIGVEGWTDKKNWIGWSKTEADQLRVGWSGVLLSTKIPDYYAQSLNNIQGLSQAPPQYMPLPGTFYSINVKTLIIPNFDASAFTTAVNQGALQVFNFLRSKYLSSLPQSEWDQIKALEIVTRTHLYTYIKDESVTKYNEDYYCHVFKQQEKFGITLNGSTFTGNIASTSVNLILSIVKTSSEQAYPTLEKGSVYIAAKFGTEWQGMKIKK
jgi:hypothetical protein